VTRKIAEEIGASLVPVREALSRLGSEGLTTHFPGGGACVRQADREEIAELYQIRTTLESFAVGEAIANLGEKEIATLHSICDEFHEVAREIRENGTGHATREQHDRFIKADFHFHDVIVGAARNRFLSKFVSDLRTLTSTFQILASNGDFLSLSAATGSWREHCGLVQALESKDHEKSMHLMAMHIQSGQNGVINYFESQWSQQRHQ
jgi:DNA-binding GntR family transcriptional regulator